MYRASRGRATFTSWMTGLPIVMLTTTGAKSGQTRTLPVLGVPNDGNLVVIASNYGQDRNPPGTTTCVRSPGPASSSRASAVRSWRAS